MMRFKSGEEVMGSDIEFTEEQQIALSKLITNWRGIANMATKLAEASPSRDIKHAMKRRAVHYNECADQLEIVVRASGSSACL